jgi:hypothetical protein
MKIQVRVKIDFRGHDDGQAKVWKEGYARLEFTIPDGTERSKAIDMIEAHVSEKLQDIAQPWVDQE